MRLILHVTGVVIFFVFVILVVLNPVNLTFLLEPCFSHIYRTHIHQSVTYVVSNQLSLLFESLHSKVNKLAYTPLENLGQP